MYLKWKLPGDFHTFAAKTSVLPDKIFRMKKLIQMTPNVKSGNLKHGE